MSDDEVKGEKFIEQNADKLVHNLVHHCAAGAKEVVDALGEQVPAPLNAETLFLFLFASRCTIEALGVKELYGERAYQFINAAIENLYLKTFPESHAQTGAFSKSLMKDVMASMVQSSPEDFIRLHASRTLGTNDPLDELLHLCLIKVFTNGQPIAQVVKQASLDLRGS